MMEIDTIVWDWNGTLLDDIDVSIETINVLLANRNLPLLNKENYLNVFGFPVQDYYERIGFNFEEEPFDIPAHEYIEGYASAVKQASLHAEVRELLKWFNGQKYRQFILSASEKNSLEMLIEHYGIKQWFISVAGLNNHYAQSKEEIGIRLMKDQRIRPEKTCLIGDTVHDFEVAQAMGCHCILIANGHQSYERLVKTGTTVLYHLSELKAVLKR